MTHPTLLAAMERIIAAGKRHGKLVAVPGGPDDVHRWSDKGVDLFFIGGDTGCMKQAAEEALRQARQ